MLCPFCDFDNIDGVDVCLECQADLAPFDPQTNDVARSVAAHPIAVLCPHRPVTVLPDMLVRDVIQMMVEERIGCVLVSNGSTLSGIFTERDVLNRVGDDARELARSVNEVMTPRPFTISRNDSIGYALQSMDLGGYRHLPVLDADGKPEGIVSVRDILRFIGVQYAQVRQLSDR